MPPSKVCSYVNHSRVHPSVKPVKLTTLTKQNKSRIYLCLGQKNNAPSDRNRPLTCKKQTEVAPDLVTEESSAEAGNN
jgi:hypothetical protein